MRLPLIVAASVLVKSACAVFADEAWHVDYHIALLGQPREDTTFFHQPNPISKASLLYTLSEKGVLGAINPRDGVVVWRQLPSRNVKCSDTIFLRAGDGQDMIVTGIDNEVRAWTAGEGRLAWELELETGSIRDLEILEILDGKDAGSAKDVLVLSVEDGGVVKRLDGSNGAIKWQHTMASGDSPYQVSASNTEVFVIARHTSIMGSPKIKVISLDPVSGKKADEYTLSSESDLASDDAPVSVGANSASPIIAWMDKSANAKLKVNIIGTKGVFSFDVDRHNGQQVEKLTVHAPYQVNSLAHFLVHYETASSHWAEVFHINLKKATVEKSYSLPKISGKGAFAVSTSDANVYFTRVTKNQIMTVSSVSHGVLGRWAVDSFGGTANRNEVEPLHATSELSIKGDTISAIRTAILLSTGEWVMLRNGVPVWQRPEMLADTTAAVFAMPAEEESLVRDLEVETYSNPVQAYIYRVTRHLQDLQLLPDLLKYLPQSFLGGLFGLSTDGARDSFGFRKVVICATAGGRLVALAVGNTKILWNVHNGGESLAWTPLLATRPDGMLLTDTDGQQQGFKLSNGERTEASTLKPTGGVTGTAATNIKYSIVDGQLKASTGSGKPIWDFSPSQGERVLNLTIRPLEDPVASIGTVLGDRKVLYKYLSPNVALLTTVGDGAKSASFYVLDTASGAVLYSNTHHGVDLSSPIASLVSENWFAYSYTVETSSGSAKGHQLVSGELFESLIPDDRGVLGAATNYSSMQAGIEPFALAQTYQIPEPISHLAVTHTRQGITSRQLLAVLAESSSIVGIPRGAIDPRRPVDRDPTKNEQAEGLVRYAPTIEFDPKWYLNHQREVIGVEKIITSPSLLESTSLIFAYGLDVFGTRLSPSFSFDVLGKDFNKFQMLATVAALFVATVLVAPLVTRKQVNARWQFA